jgi:glutamine synthetase adenylyltransferase
MGKMGARELNYSSDIDLIVLFDLDVLPVQGPAREGGHAPAYARPGPHPGGAHG